MIVGLFGASACGKTVLAQCAASKLNIPVRHCGVEIKSACLTKGHDLKSAPDDLHRAIDQQTRDWCAKVGKDCLVEGRFLDQVLADMADVILIDVIASRKVRASRLAERLGRVVSNDEVQVLDEQDDSFRRRMYSRISRLSGSYTLNTDGSTVAECSQILISLLS
jgi:cytidylate kinase